jgi:hypothetical protein
MRRGLAEALRNSGFDVLTAHEAGNRARPDSFQLDYASRLGRAIYTQNIRDYAALHEQHMRAGRSHAGVILLSNQRLSIGEQVRALQRLDRSVGLEVLKDRAWYLLNFA